METLERVPPPSRLQSEIMKTKKYNWKMWFVPVIHWEKDNPELVQEMAKKFFKWNGNEQMFISFHTKYNWNEALKLCDIK